MANDVTRASHTEITDRDPYAAYADEVNQRPFAGDLLIFTKHGAYKAGQEKDDVDMGTKMLVYMPGLKRGWVKWKENQPIKHVMGLVGEGFVPPERDELDDLNEDEWEQMPDGKLRDPWQQTNHLPMCDTQGNLYTFVSSSKGGLSEVGKISDLYANRRRMKPDEIPVIELQGRSYDHKIYGETMAPVFKVVGWVPIPTNFSELNTAVEDSNDETLALEDLMDTSGNDAVGHEDDYQEELDTTPAPRKAPQAPQKPVQKVIAKPAPVKPVPKTTSKAPPQRSGKGASNGRRSPRI